MKKVKLYNATTELMQNELGAGELQWRWSYTGRGMSEPCVGLYIENQYAANEVLSRTLMELALLISATEPEMMDQDDLDHEIFARWRKDAFGQGVIFYWPDIQADEV